jgi:hypothetical protein
LAGGGFYVFLAGGSKDLKDRTVLSSAFISCTLLLLQIRFYDYGKHFSSIKKKIFSFANNFAWLCL